MSDCIPPHTHTHTLVARPGCVFIELDWLFCRVLQRVGFVLFRLSDLSPSVFDLLFFESVYFLSLSTSPPVG